MRTLEITTYIPCVNSCKFCPQDKLIQHYTGKPRLTYDEFIMILNKIPLDVRIDFSAFSEPFGNYESSAMMAESFRRGYKVTLFTTLVGFKESDLQKIKDIKFNLCILHPPDDFNFITNEKKWIEAYRMFSAHIHIDHIYYHLGNLSEAVAEAMPDAQKTSILNRANNVSRFIAPHSKRKAGHVICPMTSEFNQNIMLPNGDVYLCCMDWSLQHRLGNLFKSDYESLFESEEYKKIVQGAADESIDLLCRWCVR